MRFKLLSLLFFSLTLSAEKVGLLIVATGKYIQFVEPLIQSARTHFCKGHKVTYFVFTDQPFPEANDIVVLPHKKMGWPFDTMMRFEAYKSAEDLYIKQDYLFACDADMLFAGKVGQEIFSERVATLHPGFTFGSPFPRTRGAYETNPKSTAYVKDDEGTSYFAGGFWGGKKEEVLKIIDTILSKIHEDLDNEIIAVWHDESHWNRYCIDNPPTHVLSPSYCYPEAWLLPYKKKLLALDKDHEAIR